MSSPRRSRREKNSPYKYTPSLALAKRNARICRSTTTDLNDVTTPRRPHYEHSKSTNYTLNTTKAAQKMISATEQDLDVEAEFRAGNLMMKFTPAAFLMFHKQILLYYENSKILQATSYLKKDENNLVVEESLSIKPISTDGTNRRQIYRINMYKTAFTIEANGRDIGNFIRKDLQEILKSLPSKQFLTTTNNVIQDTCKAFLSSKDNKRQANISNVNRNNSTTDKQLPLAISNTNTIEEMLDVRSKSETNLHATAVRIVPLPSDEEVASTCSSCEKSIENADFVLCILCEEKHHYWCQSMTYEQYNTMNINDLEDFKCSQCKLQLKDLQCTETSKITHQNLMVQLPQSPEPDTRNTATTPVPTVLNISVPAIETNVQTGQGLVTSCENQTIPKVMNTPAYANTNQHELHTIAKNNLIASNSQNVQKTTVPKKPTKSSKQDELKSKLSVAEAHIMRLESTILDNNKLIRNLKLQQVGMQQEDIQTNSHTHINRCTNSLDVNKCHCTTMENRLRDLEREMTNMKLQQLENQILAMKNQTNSTILQPAMQPMINPVPPQPIHLQHQAPPHPWVVHNIPPPPYIVGQPVRNIQPTFVQTITPTNNFMVQQMQNPTYIPNVHGQITEMKHSDSNNCIAVTRPMYNILQTDSSHQNISTNNFMEQQIQNPAYVPNVHSHMTEMKHSDSNNCIAVTRPLNNILHLDVRHQNISSLNPSTQRIVHDQQHSIPPQKLTNQGGYTIPVEIVNQTNPLDINQSIQLQQIENMHPRCFEEFENHNPHIVNTKDSKNCFAVHDHNNHSNSAVTDCKKRKSSTRLEQHDISYLREESIPRKQHEKYPILKQNKDIDTNSKNCFAVGQPTPDVNTRINSMDNQQRFPPINEHQKHNTGSFLDRNQRAILEPGPLMLNQRML